MTCLDVEIAVGYLRESAEVIQAFGMDGQVGDEGLAAAATSLSGDGGIGRGKPGFNPAKASNATRQSP